jgi:hypothetical protein
MAGGVGVGLVRLGRWVGWVAMRAMRGVGLGGVGGGFLDRVGREGEGSGVLLFIHERRVCLLWVCMYVCIVVVWGCGYEWYG